MPPLNVDNAEKNKTPNLIFVNGVRVNNPINSTAVAFLQVR